MHQILQMAAAGASVTLDDLRIDGLLSPNAQQFAGYWRSLPKRGLVPDRSSFDPTSQRGILSHFSILEIVAPDLARYRLAGTAEVERYGMDVTGRNYLDFVAPERRPFAARAFQAMIELPCGMLAIIHSTSRSGRQITNESLGFPVRGNDGMVNLLYFQSNTALTHEYHDSRRDSLDTHVQVARRLFVDIGGGTPKDFREA